MSLVPSLIFACRLKPPEYSQIFFPHSFWSWTYPIEPNLAKFGYLFPRGYDCYFEVFMLNLRLVISRYTSACMRLATTVISIYLYDQFYCNFCHRFLNTWNPNWTFHLRNARLFTDNSTMKYPQLSAFTYWWCHKDYTCLFDGRNCYRCIPIYWRNISMGLGTK